MTAKLTFHPLGNADCTRIDLADGRKILLDYADRSGAMAPGSDLQGLFEGHPNKQDFLTAGKVDDVIGLCLSGGGFRAMIYHVGVLVRLNELGLLSRIQEVASVSGGSITAGKLAEAWKRLRFDDKGVALNFVEQVADRPLGSIGCVSSLLVRDWLCRLVVSIILISFQRSELGSIRWLLH